MARMQRWRRRGSAGEEIAPETDLAPDVLDETPEDASPSPEPADERTEDDESTTSDAAAQDVALEDPEVELLDTEDPEAPDEVDDLAEDADAVHPGSTPPLPALPHVPESTGIGGRLLGGREPGQLLAVQLLQAAHAKQAISTAVVMGLAAAVTGRPAREAGVVLLTVLVGQTILGWHNDIVDRHRDLKHGVAGKPVAQGLLSTENAWYAILVAGFLVVPLSITTGITAGIFYLASLAIGMLGNIIARTGFFSWVSWAASYALLPCYLSYGGWGGQAEGSPPEPAIVVLAGLLGIGVHFMRAVWGLVADHEDGWTYLPLKLGLKLGATRLLALSTVYTAVIAIAIAVVGAKVGLSR